MQTENLSFNDGGEREVIEDFSEVLPDVGVTVLADGLIVETVDLGSSSTFVVTSSEGDSIRVTHLQREQKTHTFD